MSQRGNTALWLAAAALITAPLRAAPITWTGVDVPAITSLADDDIARHSDDAAYLTGITVAQSRFSENGFNWHLIRFTNPAKPDGPLWVVPHDDENAAFDSMIMALRLYGGTGIAVNSGPGSERRQAGQGRCGENAEIKSSCDPNRNFSEFSPVFTAAFLDQASSNQPIIALHTNSAGFAGDGQGGSGDVTIVDKTAYNAGTIKPRADAIFGINQVAELTNYDTLGLIPFRATAKDNIVKAALCGISLANAGVHFWAERVGRSDGSLSNYIVLNRPNLAYFNAESRREVDLGIASTRHMLMIAVYMKSCH